MQKSDGPYKYNNEDSPLKIRILADFNHDGIIDVSNPYGDFTDKFAIVIPVSKMPTATKFNDWQLAGGVNPLDVGTMKLRLNRPVSKDFTLTLRVDENWRGKITLFQRHEIKWENLGSDGIWHVAWGTSLGHKEIIFGIIANSLAINIGKDKKNSDFILNACIVDDNGLEISAASVRFKVAPFLLTSALDTVDEVLVIKNKLTAGFVKALERIVPQTGARLRAIALENVPDYDVWIQDTVEIGRYCVPSSQGARQAVGVLRGFRYRHDDLNWEPLDTNARKYFDALNAIVVDVAEPRAEKKWIDWYGNLEVSPPVTSRDGRKFPLGRILVGVQKDLSMHPDVLNFLDAQRFQTPPLIIDTSRLLIGHVDEVVNFVPAHSSPGFRVLIPSPFLARDILKNLADKGFKRQPIFANHKEETTVEKLLEEVGESEENDLIQTTIYETRMKLCEGLGVNDDDFIEIPVLFQEGVAVIPNCVNGLICNGHAILPDPLGPQVDGEDSFAVPIRAALSTLGINVHFVDIWEPYHRRSGEIHCGTNTIRRVRQSPAWWEIV